jgi:hypothetical protein
MALAPPPSATQPAELEPAPLLLPWDLRLTPEQFERVCQANRKRCWSWRLMAI